MVGQAFGRILSVGFEWMDVFGLRTLGWHEVRNIPQVTGYSIETVNVGHCHSFWKS
jgi:hypothetical protein